MLTIGITGGMGSGKSTVCKIFSTFGIPVYDADSRAKALYTENQEVKTQVINLLGEAVYTGNNLNKTKVAEMVFGNTTLLRSLNGIIHPAVAEDFSAWKEEQQKNSSSYIIKEAAIMIEAGSYKECDRLILVTSPQELRIKRIMKRDGSSRQQIEERLNKQWSDEMKKQFADYIIENNEHASLIHQVMNIHEELLKLS